MTSHYDWETETEMIDLSWKRKTHYVVVWNFLSEDYDLKFISWIGGERVRKYGIDSQHAPATISHNIIQRPTQYHVSWI